MDFVYEKVSIADARRVLDGLDGKECLQATPDVHRWKAKPDALLPRTLKWLMLLPQNIRPFNLARCYPRILNEVCEQWGLKANCGRYLERLLKVDGTKREGFPPHVASEIIALAAYRVKRLQTVSKDGKQGANRVL